MTSQLASKYEDGWRVTFDDIINYLPAGSQGRDQAKLDMIKFEQDICRSLDWKLTGTYSMYITYERNVEDVRYVQLVDCVQHVLHAL